MSVLDSATIDIIVTVRKRKLLWTSVPHRLQAADVDRWQLVYPWLQRRRDVVHLNEIAPVDGRPAGRCEQRRLKRFAQSGLQT